MQKPVLNQDIKPMRPSSSVAHRPSHVLPKKKFLMHYFLVLLTLAIVILGVSLIWWKISTANQQSVASEQYQAVYLNTGQIYFGKLQNTSGDFLTLKQAFTTQGQSATTQQTDQNQATIIKVSQQVYGPDDSIALKSNQVLFWQNLRNDSKVVQAIEATK
jgi:hypothetical protein